MNKNLPFAAWQKMISSSDDDKSEECFELTECKWFFNFCMRFFFLSIEIFLFHLTFSAIFNIFASVISSHIWYKINHIQDSHYVIKIDVRVYILRLIAEPVVFRILSYLLDGKAWHWIQCAWQHYNNFIG